MTSTARDAAPVTLSLDEAHGERVRAWAVEGYPNEACGLLIGEDVGPGAGSGGGARRVLVTAVRKARNVETERPADRYVLDPEAFLAADREARATGREVVGFWHSHPDSPAKPSDTDLARAWDGYVYAIVPVERGRAGEMRIWIRQDGSFTEGRLQT